MTTDERARAAARIDVLLDDVFARLERMKARDPERERLKIESHVALARLHRANVALREALS
jgi:hypothetical protein